MKQIRTTGRLKGISFGSSLVMLLGGFIFTLPMHPGRPATTPSYMTRRTANGACTMVRDIDQLPLAFTPNMGQWPDSILYRTSSGGAAIWFTATGACYQFTRQVKPVTRPDESALNSDDHLPRPFPASERCLLESMMIRAKFIGSNPEPRPAGGSLLAYRSNYFIGNDPAKWRTDIPNYTSLIYKNIYTGIDLRYYGNSRRLEYDFVVAAGADYSRIQISYEGATSCSVDANGDLIVETAWGRVTEKAPVVYQTDGTEQTPVTATYCLTGDHTFGFKLGSNYDPSLAVVIDPILAYSTYLGGADDELGYSIAVDVNKCAYITGNTGSANFPSVGPYQTVQGAGDIFVSKLSASGSALVYSTYLGGSDGIDYGYGIAVDSAGAAYVTGFTTATNYPTLNPYQTHQGATDAFVTKLSPAGNSLAYSTYLGGISNGDYAQAIAVNRSGQAFVTGYTFSSDFPNVNPYRLFMAGMDGFVTKLSSAGNSLIYSTFLGGSGMDACSAIAVDSAGEAFVTGLTSSSDFPVVNSFNTYQGGNDVFVTKLASGGSSLVYSTMVGGTGADIGTGIAVSKSGEAFVTGYTGSTNYPTSPSPFQSFQGSNDGFVTRLSPDGSTLIYSTYLGSTGNDNANAIALDGAGFAYITGVTDGSNFPVASAIQPFSDSTDVFVTRLDSSGHSLAYSTFLGGAGNDDGHGIAVDAAGAAYIVGRSGSAAFPTANSYQSSLAGTSDAIVTKISSSCCNKAGDANSDGNINVGDAVFLINRVFKGGPAPVCAQKADANGDGNINVGDAVRLINYVFKAGAAPICGP
jgi:hypothetical protein